MLNKRCGTLPKVNCRGILRGNQQDGIWLAHVNLATHFDRSKTVRF